MKFVCVIPARGGSKGIKGKNLVTLNTGVSILTTAIKKAQTCTPLKDSVYVSSDNEGVLYQAKQAGALAVRRPIKLAGDDVTTEDVLLDMDLDCEYLIFLQCTAPFFAASTIYDVIMELLAGADSAFAAYPFDKEVWDKYTEKTLRKITYTGEIIRQPRQKKKPYWVECGSVYGMRMDKFKEDQTRFCGKCRIVPAPWIEGFQIDDYEDLKYAKKLSS